MIATGVASRFLAFNAQISQGPWPIFARAHRGNLECRIGPLGVVPWGLAIALHKRRWGLHDVTGFGDRDLATGEMSQARSVKEGLDAIFDLHEELLDHAMVRSHVNGAWHIQDPIDTRQLPLKASDDLPHGDFRGTTAQGMTAARPPGASNQTGGSKLDEDLL